MFESGPRMLDWNRTVPGAPGGNGPALAFTIIMKNADEACMGVLYPPPNQVDVCGDCSVLRFDWCGDGAESDCAKVDEYFECVMCEHTLFEAHLNTIPECAPFATKIGEEFTAGYFGEGVYGASENIFKQTCRPGEITHKCIDFDALEKEATAYTEDDLPFKAAGSSSAAAGLVTAAGASIAVTAMLM